VNAEVWPHFLAAGACWFSGLIERASHHAAIILELAENLRNRGFLANALVGKSIIAMTRGDWDATREFTDRGFSVQPGFFWPLGPRIKLEYETGNYEAGQVFLKRLLEIARRAPADPTGEHAGVASLIPQIAYLTGDESQLDLAKEAAEVVLSSPATPPLIATTTRIGRGLTAAIQQDAEAAEEYYTALLPLQGSYIDDTIVSIDRALGILARAMGGIEMALTHFEEALAICRKGGILLEIPWVCYDYASTLLQTSPDKLERASALLDEGLSIARELGMRPVMEKMIALQERAYSLQVAPAASYPDGLTQREVDVLRLVAAGKSNQQIADELVISVHTVIYHVRNIFSKTASANRAEATAYAIRHGLGV
jgi:DNA-binding CsgD family transcriptional regulator